MGIREAAVSQRLLGFTIASTLAVATAACAVIAISRRRIKKAKAIVLPSGQMDTSHLGIDIGGTLAKMIYLKNENAPDNIMTTGDEKIGESGERYPDLAFDCPKLGGKLYFFKFETRNMEKAVEMLKYGKFLKTTEAAERPRIFSSGGGAFKFSALVLKELGIEFVSVDEIDSMLDGFRFVTRYGPTDEVFALDRHNWSEGEMTKVPVKPSIRQPFMVVNIGSGTSMLKVHPDGSFESVGGTSMGGGTFWGLCRLITSAASFEEAMEMCARGKSTNVDKLVKDIYGGDYERFNLKGTVVASSYVYLLCHFLFVLCLLRFHHLLSVSLAAGLHVLALLQLWEALFDEGPERGKGRRPGIGFARNDHPADWTYCDKYCQEARAAGFDLLSGWISTPQPCLDAHSSLCLRVPKVKGPISPACRLPWCHRRPIAVRWEQHSS